MSPAYVTQYGRSGECFWTKHYGVHRWEPLLADRPGLYRVVHTINIEAGEFFGMFSVPHPYAVMDDFGNLVRVQ